MERKPLSSPLSGFFLIYAIRHRGDAYDFSGIKKRAENEQIRIHCAYGNPAEDLYMLSICDYIIGAPSTFSLVASMYHDTPLYWMMSDKEDIRFDFFNNMFKHIV